MHAISTGYEVDSGKEDLVLFSRNRIHAIGFMSPDSCCGIYALEYPCHDIRIGMHGTGSMQRDLRGVTFATASIPRSQYHGIHTMDTLITESTPRNLCD